VPLLFLPLICVRWVCIITQYVASCVCHLCVFGVLVFWWSACELFRCSYLHIRTLRNSSQADHQQTRTPNTHRWHTQEATYCVIIQNQRTKISGRNNNGTKHSGGPPEDGHEKIPKHVGLLYLQTRFYNFIGFKCWSECVLKCEYCMGWIVKQVCQHAARCDIKDWVQHLNSLGVFGVLRTRWSFWTRKTNLKLKSWRENVWSNIKLLSSIKVYLTGISKGD
jgi:hypothetical protein